MPAPQLGYTTRCRVTEVIDGDTLEVQIVKKLRVRLIDCWAPETRTKDDKEKRSGILSKEHLRYLAAGREGTLLVPGHQDNELGDAITMSRALGRVWVDGQERSLSELQVAAKHAATRKGARLGT